MTTSNQIAYMEAKEKKRSNLMKEKQTSRDLNRKDREFKWKQATDLIKPVTSVGDLIGKMGNDPAWYNEDPQLVKDVAQISFNTPLGDQFPNEIGSETAKTTVPGIMAITFMPSIGLTNTSGSGSVADVAAKNVYAYVRHANSGARNYEAPDLAQYMYGMTENISFWASLRRLYSALLTTKAHNKYWSRKMVYALGFDYEDLMSHISDLRAYINAFRIQLNAFYIPKDLPLLSRRVWLNSKFFKDSPIKKSQDYVFVQQRFLHYEDTLGTVQSFFPEDTSGVNDVDFYPGANVTFAQIRLLGNKLIEKMITSEDAGIMSGDILKAYGETGVVFVESTPEDYHMESEYSEQVLSQITNANLVGGTVANDSYDIKQDSETGELYQGQLIYDYDSVNQSPIGRGIIKDFGGGDQQSDTATNPLNGIHYLINFYKDEPTPDDIMVATRLKCGLVRNVKTVPGQPTNTNRLTAIVSCGTEICVQAYVIYIDNTADWKYTTLNLVPDALNMRKAMAIMAFDWAPAVYVYQSGDRPYEYIFRVQDYSNYAIVSRTNLDNMHYVAVLSELGVPKLGLKVRTR